MMPDSLLGKIALGAGAATLIGGTMLLWRDHGIIATMGYLITSCF